MRTAHPGVNKVTYHTPYSWTARCMARTKGIEGQSLAEPYNHNVVAHTHTHELGHFETVVVGHSGVTTHPAVA